MTTYNLFAMRFPIILLCIFFSCTNDFKEVSPQSNSKNILDSLRIDSKSANILLHHGVQKKSLISKIIYTPQGIDSLFRFIGQVNNDTTCLHSGLYNYFGQINLYKDSARDESIAEIHFVIGGNCTGFYLQTKSYLRRYNMTAAGKTFISELYNNYRNKLK